MVDCGLRREGECGHIEGDPSRPFWLRPIDDRRADHLRITTGIDDAQEWNGRREITEKTFKFDGSTVPSLLFLALAFPGFIYVVMKDELVRCRDGAGRESLGVVL